MGWVFRKLLGIDVNKYLTKHQKLLIGLKQEGVINKVVITTKNDKGYTKMVMYKIIFNRGDRMYLALSSHPYDFVYIYNIPFSINSFRDYISAHRCSKVMIERIGDYRGCIKSNKIPYIIRSNVFNKYKENLNKLLDNEVNELGFDSYLEYRSLYNKNVRKKDNIINKIIMIKACLNAELDRIFYLPNFVDNRGRQYVHGVLSPTFNKYVRDIIEIYDETEHDKNLFSSNYYKIIIDHCKFLGKYKVESDLLNYYLINLFIEVGKPYIKGNNNKYSFTLEDFINKGIEYYEKGIDNNYTYNIKNIIEKGFLDKKIIIYKDATSSGLQNFGIIAGYKKDLLKYLNLSGLEWCDTYQFIINKEVSDDRYKNRSLWKKTIMTIPYNATWHTCYESFIKELNKLNIKYNNTEIIQIHKNFYHKIKKDLKIFLYVNGENYRDSMIYFQYLKPLSVNEIEYKIQYRGDRDKYTRIEVEYDYDHESSDSALEANNLHYLDSLLVKYLLDRHLLITIHDCYGISLDNIHNVIDDVNTYYNKYIEHDYSLFIIK